MQFNQIIGQPDTKQHLAEMVQHNRLSHALLFLGREGSGALPLAMAFAQYVVCDTVNGRKAETAGPSLFGEEPAGQLSTVNRQLNSDSCGACPSCLKAGKMVHPDIHYSYPVVPRK